MANHTLVLEIWYDAAWHTVPVYVRDGCKLKRGTDSPGSDSDPAVATLTIDNRSGNYSPRSVVSSLYGKIGQNTKAQLTIDGAVRLTGEVASWRPERAVKGDAWTKIVIAGVLQRIGRGTDPIQSAVTRAALSLGAVSVWPLEDLDGTTQASPAVDGGVALRVGSGSEPDWAADDTLPGSLPLPKMLDSADPFVTLPNAVLSGPVAGTNATAWTVSIWVKATATPATTLSVLRWGPRPASVASSVAPWDLTLFNAAPGFEFTAGYANTVYAKSLGTGKASFDGAWHHVVIQASQVGLNIETTLYVDTLLGTSTIPDPGTLQPVTTAELLCAMESTPAPITVWAGGLAVFDGLLSAGEIAALYTAGLAHVGETAADRFTRICTEQAITPTVVGTAAESVAMGPQKPLPLLELFDEVARTDDASIFETRSAIGLTMRTGASKLNQAPDFTISYLGQIEPPLLPVFGDEGIRNDVTAASPGGAARRVEQTTGPHNTQLPEDDPQGVGRYQTRLDVNPETSDALADAAGWRVNLGTFDGTWYAKITADLDAAPGIAAAVAALDIGDVIGISNLPVDEALDTVESVIIGIEDDVLPKRRLVTFFCIPAEPYRVGVLAATTGDTDPFVGHLETDGSTTVGVTAASATTFSVATTSGPLWTTTADDFPFDVIVGGQRVTISSVSGSSSPQTFTVQSAALGGRQIRYPIPAGSAVNVQQPIILAL